MSAMNPYLEIFQKQRDLFVTNVTRSYEWRIDQLDRMAAMVSENEKELQDAVAEDFKTSPFEYDFETFTALGEVAFQKSQLRTWMQPSAAPVPRRLRESGHTAMVIREPYGVTLLIGPFNGPLSLFIRPAIMVLGAGNPCVLKPSEALPATTGMFSDLVPKYFDPAAVALVSAGREDAARLLELPFDFIFFTGSTRTGKVIARAAAENLTPTILECGGQNPALVDDTANLSDAAKKIVWGAMAWGGQWCTSPGYAYVHHSVADEFASLARTALVELYGEEPDKNRDFSKVISERDVNRLSALIDPALVIAGGRADPARRYLDPTLLYPVRWADKIMEDEIFGPILPVLTYQTLDEAFAQIASRPRPLAGFIFSREQKNIDRFLSELSFGGGAVNQANIHLFVETMPFGGTGASGIGHYYGKDGFDALTHAKSILISPPDVDVDHLFPPSTPEKIQAFHDTWYEY